MSRIYFDAACKTCGPFRALEGDPTRCPVCYEFIEKEPTNLEGNSIPVRIEGNDIGKPQKITPITQGKERLNS
jgi:hypothetical protein